MENINNQMAILGSGGIATLQTFQTLNDFRLACQNFITRINTLPKEESIGTTADKKAKTIFISHIEMTLDEYFFGLWSTEHFTWNVISNEVVGSIDLVMTHPVTGQSFRRVGAAAVTIMVDAVPEDIKADPKLRNQWALDVSNKKPSALDMGFPKLKSECIKNAANSLGKMFGRDLNRKEGNTDDYSPLAKPILEIPEELRIIISEKTDADELTQLWKNNPEYVNNPEFLKLLNARKEALKQTA